MKSREQISEEMERLKAESRTIYTQVVEEGENEKNRHLVAKFDSNLAKISALGWVLSSD